MPDHVGRPARSALQAAAILLALGSCEGTAEPDPFSSDSAPPPTPAHARRQAEYLDACVAAGREGGGGLYGQVCLLARGLPADPEPILKSSEKVSRREDTSDFDVAALMRLLYLDRETGSLAPDLRSLIEETVLEFKYWLDEPGQDKMAYWTENHQILFHSSELLAGQLFPENPFPNSGISGDDHARHATPLVERWLDFRGRFGFSEWHSNVYFNEDIPALVNLVDFAESSRIRIKAAMVLDVLAFDLLNNMYDGHFATTHGRTYPNAFLDGLRDSTSEAAWIMTGLGRSRSPTNFSGAFLATSASYRTPAVIEEVAETARTRHEHRQRDSIDVADGPMWGIGYDEPEDIVFWAGLAALVAPPVVEGTVRMMDRLNLWDAFLFGDLPPDLRSLVRTLAGTGQLDDLSREIEAFSRGIALETVNTYTYRTPHYQLSGAQDYKPGFWGTQTQIWQATLDGQAYAFTAYPTRVAGFSEDVEFAGDWIGGWLPRATFYRTVGVIQYRKPEVSMLDTFITSDHTHAFFPRTRFDEVLEIGHWKIGRKGDGYLALYSNEPTSWSDRNSYELDALATSNVWIVEMGSRDENGSFEAFVEAISSARVEVGDFVRYESPSVGAVEVGWSGPMTVAGKTVSLGPYDRWDNAFSKQAFGERLTTVTSGGWRLELDFVTPERRLAQIAP